MSHISSAMQLILCKKPCPLSTQLPAGSCGTLSTSLLYACRLESDVDILKAGMQSVQKVIRRKVHRGVRQSLRHALHTSQLEARLAAEKSTQQQSSNIAARTPERALEGRQTTG